MKEILKLTQMFSQLDDTSLHEVESAVSIRHVNRGEIIFNEGEVASAFFIVGQGKVKVFKLSPDGKEQILMIATPGDSFAEAALFAGGVYPASAQSLEQTELLIVNRERFVSLLGRNPNLAMNLIARLSQLLRQMTILVEGLSLTDVTTRLAHHLIQIASTAGSDTVQLTLPEKKSVLASQLGTIPETLSRSLAKLSRDGIIRVDGSHIHILDFPRLKQLGG